MTSATRWQWASARCSRPGTHRKARFVSQSAPSQRLLSSHLRAETRAYTAPQPCLHTAPRVPTAPPRVHQHAPPRPNRPPDPPASTRPAPPQPRSTCTKRARHPRVSIPATPSLAPPLLLWEHLIAQQEHKREHQSEGHVRVPRRPDGDHEGCVSGHRVLYDGRIGRSRSG